MTKPNNPYTDNIIEPKIEQSYIQIKQMVFWPFVTSVYLVLSSSNAIVK